MRWQQSRRSDNVEDRRGHRPGAGAVGIGGLGILVLALLVYLMGGDLGTILSLLVQQGPAAPVDSGSEPAAPGGYDEQRDFVAAVLGDTEDTWSSVFAAQGQRYEPPHLVLFSDTIGSACGFASAASGPFYCPADQQVYLDLSFFRELDARFGAPGDFAQAYVIAHEVGHHIQTLLGVSDRVDLSRRQGSETEANALSVRQELQADCFAGVWGHHAQRQRLLEDGDVEEGLNAASAIGDDRLQRQGRGRVTPETWTHGSSEQRARWLRRGLQTGLLDACDTFTGQP